MQRIPYQFSLLPDDIPGEVESFFVMISNSWDDQFSMYLPPSLYAEVASIVIIDTESECSEMHIAIAVVQLLLLKFQIQLDLVKSW